MSFIAFIPLYYCTCNYLSTCFFIFFSRNYCNCKKNTVYLLYIHVGRDGSFAIIEFWDRVKAILQTNGHTYQWVEDNTGIKQGTLGSWLSRGDTYPAVDNAFKLANVFGVSVKFLMTGKEYVENKLDNETIINILNYLQNQDETNLHRIEGVLMALGFLSAKQLVQPQKRA